jgi:hypothetical protein
MVVSLRDEISIRHGRAGSGQHTESIPYLVKGIPKLNAN